MKFTEAQLEEAFIELLGQEDIPHVLGEDIKGTISKLVREKLTIEKKLTAAEKNKKEDIIMALKKQKGGKSKLKPVDYAIATDRAKKLAEKNEK